MGEAADILYALPHTDEEKKEYSKVKEASNTLSKADKTIM